MIQEQHEHIEYTQDNLKDPGTTGSQRVHKGNLKDPGPTGTHTVHTYTQGNLKDSGTTGTHRVHKRLFKGSRNNRST